jgi:hypothetical protein
MIKQPIGAILTCFFFFKIYSPCVAINVNTSNFYLMYSSFSGGCLNLFVYDQILHSLNLPLFFYRFSYEKKRPKAKIIEALKSVWPKAGIIEALESV